MEYAEFKEELEKLGFEIDGFHMPFMRREHPMLMVSNISLPTGVHLRGVLNKGSYFWETIRIEYTNMYKCTIAQIQYTIELNGS